MQINPLKKINKCDSLDCPEDKMKCINKVQHDHIMQIRGCENTFGDGYETFPDTSLESPSIWDRVIDAFNYASEQNGF